MFGIAYHREQREVQLSGYSGQETQAWAEVVRFDGPSRLRRAWLGLSTWWAVAGVSVLIPVAHFALVPGFFLYGIYSFTKRRRTAVVVVSVHGTCPDCDHEQAFDPPARWEDGMAVTCGKCYRSLRGLTVNR